MSKYDGIINKIFPNKGPYAIKAVKHGDILYLYGDGTKSYKIGAKVVTKVNLKSNTVISKSRVLTSVEREHNKFVKRQAYRQSQAYLDKKHYQDLRKPFYTRKGNISQAAVTALDNELNRLVNDGLINQTQAIRYRNRIMTEVKHGRFGARFKELSPYYQIHKFIKNSIEKLLYNAGITTSYALEYINSVSDVVCGLPNLLDENNWDLTTHGNAKYFYYGGHTFILEFRYAEDGFYLLA